MSTVTRHSDTCKILQESTKKSVDVVVQHFLENDRLDVIVNKSVKLSMRWNGKLYEGRMAGMDFTSTGPTLSKTQTGTRG